MNPSTEEEICQVQQAGAQDVDLAVKAARHAFEEGEWAQWPIAARAAFLNNFAANVEKHTEELAGLESLDNGKPLAAATLDVRHSIGILRYYAGWADKIHGQTLPMNGPFLAYTK